MKLFVTFKDQDMPLEIRKPENVKGVLQALSINEGDTLTYTDNESINLNERLTNIQSIEITFEK